MTHPYYTTVCIMCAVAVSLSSGCSDDTHEFRSSVDLPTTVALHDAARDRTLWTKDIPVEHRLVLDLDRQGENELAEISMRPGTQAKWELFGPPNMKTPVGSDTIALPGTPVMIKVSYRPSPEFPPEPALDEGDDEELDDGSVRLLSP